jgi:hypothetical protein
MTFPLDCLHALRAAASALGPGMYCIRVLLGDRGVLIWLHVRVLRVPNHCGVPNFYQTPLRCNVTNPGSEVIQTPAKPPTWCEGAPQDCTSGPKQGIYFNVEQSNVVLTGYQADGSEKSPNYNLKMGFSNGAQNDIFVAQGPANYARTYNYIFHRLPSS